MKVKYFLSLFVMISAFGFSQIGTNFNEPAGGTISYVDPDITSHDLDNHGGGQPSVMHLFTGGELGFTSTFIQTRTGASNLGMSDGDAVGVITDDFILSSSDLTSWSTGNALSIEDSDGIFLVEFDAVSLVGTSSPRLQLDYWIDGTTYESTYGANDRLFIGLELDGSTIVTIIDSDGGGLGGGVGTDLNGALPEDIITAIDFDLSPYIGSTVKLIIEADINHGPEQFIIDSILFTEGSHQSLSVIDYESPINDSFSIYPNPVRDSFTISGENQNKTLYIEVYNIMGKKVLSQKNNSANNVSVEHLTPGIYLVKITNKNKNQTITKKIIIK